MTPIFIDFETYSSEPIKTAGMYRYTESSDFEILLAGYAVGMGGEVNVIDSEDDEFYLKFHEFVDLLYKKEYFIVAHNAAFERLCILAYKYEFPPEKFLCTATLSLYAGFPEALGRLSKVLHLEEGKKDTGKDLIKFFCVPQPVSKKNPEGKRNLPCDHPEEWKNFRTYLKYDVLSEREVYRKLLYALPSAHEHKIYALDQRINDNGVNLDIRLAMRADALNRQYVDTMRGEVENEFGVNLKSTPSLKKFVKDTTGRNYDKFRKEDMDTIIAECGDEDVTAVLNARRIVNKTSCAKYAAMLGSVCADGRLRGLYRYYGAKRTGRWAGRLVQMQNLPQNHLRYLDEVRDDVKSDMPLETFELFWSDRIPDTLSQLIRTAFIAGDNHVFHVADYSAIEARVIACISREEWRMKAFTEGKDIYVASASMMFGLPYDQCGKGTPYRQHGKVAELALGYGGWVRAMETMDRKKEIPAEQYKGIILKWRDKSPHIVELWEEMEKAAKLCIRNKKTVHVDRYGVRACSFEWEVNNSSLCMRLPSGRRLFYPFASLKTKEVFGNPRQVICYMGENEQGQWVELDTYGGKLTENLIQAIARDLLAHGMMEIERRFPVVKICGHVHDETINRVPVMKNGKPVISLQDICDAMADIPEWAKPYDFPLHAEGFTSSYYKKD